MDAEAIQRRKEELGEWTAHNIELAEGVFTRGSRLYGDEYRVRRVVQGVADPAGRPFDQLRAPAPARLEGLYSIEPGRRGAGGGGDEGRAGGGAEGGLGQGG